MCEITLLWEGGEHKFALRLKELRALQDATDAGPEELLQRMSVGRWRVDDLFNTIRFGLIGGGMSATEAGPLVTRMFETHPLSLFKEPAYKIVAAALVGVEGDPVGEQEGAATPPPNGNSAASTN